MRKPTSTYTTRPETPDHLRELAVELNILTTRSARAGQGNASGLLDYIGQLVETHGAAAIARRLEDG
jgi:hypothetical protein